MADITNAQMQAVLAGGGVVEYRSREISDPALLPSDAQIAADNAADALAAASIVAKVKAGTPTDGDFTAPPVDGTVVGDTSANKLWIRLNGVWRFAALT